MVKFHDLEMVRVQLQLMHRTFNTFLAEFELTGIASFLEVIDRFR
jgi:hypothetical protein